MGRRNVLVAVVDNGTSSFLRFSEAEFAKLPWRGVGRAD
jgi:tRNA-splicing endonuclease subunit Sen54